jgi:alanyl aminopeptidase
VLSPVLAMAAHSNDAAYFDKLVSTAKAATNHNQKAQILSGLGGFSDKALVERALALSIGKEFDSRDALPVLFSLLGARETRDVTYAFIKLHFSEIEEKTSGFERQYLFAIPHVYCDAAHRADAEGFFTPLARSVDGGERSLANALESISLCEAGLKAALPSLEEFLKAY